MAAVTIDQLRCDRQPGCPARRACPQGAIVRSETRGWVVVTERCTGCGACIRVCPMQAITFS